MVAKRRGEASRLLPVFFFCGSDGLIHGFPQHLPAGNTQLNRSDVDLSKLECKVLGKGDKEWIVYMDSVAGMLVEEYLKSRTDDSPALFVSKGTDRLKPGGVRLMLNRVADEAGVVHVHPHKFRRTLATSLIRHGMPIQEVAHILGHEKLNTTMKYVVMDETGVAQSYRKYV